MDKRPIKLFATFFTALFLLPLAALGEGIRQERVVLAGSPAQTLIEGEITGNEIVDYLVEVQGGTTLSVDLQTSNAGAYFNIQPAGAEEALFIGASRGTVADLYLSDPGDYAIRVYLVRSAARRNETARYSLAIGLSGPDYADGLAGGPDFWQVAGVGGGDALNLREGPSTRYRVTGKLRNGDVLRNDGCRLSGEDRWCRIRASGSGVQGWVAGRFLIESAAPAAPTVPPGGPVGNGTPFDATGSVPCATAAGQPSRPCLFGVIRQGPGNAGVWIALGDGQERHILFEAGEPVAANSGDALSYEKDADLYLIRVGDERYEVPEAVVYGG